VILVSGHVEEVGGGGAAAANDLLKSRGLSAQFVLDEGLLVVADKESLELRLLATGGRFLAGWHAVDPQRYSIILGE